MTAPPDADGDSPDAEGGGPEGEGRTPEAEGMAPGAVGGMQDAVGGMQDAVGGAQDAVGGAQDAVGGAPDAEGAAWGMLARRATVARVYTNRSCNQGCAFCDQRAASDARTFLRGAVARIDRVTHGVCVITGGEPTMRRDLEALVSRAATRAEFVVLETNATLVDVVRARALKDAGLDLARVHLPGWGADADAITRDPGGFARALAGLDAFLDAGVRVEVATPIVRANAASVAELPGHLAGRAIDAWVLSAPRRGPAPESHLPLAEVPSVIERAEAAARRRGLEVRLEAHTHIPPCLFSSPSRVARMYSLTPGGRDRAGYARVTACEACVVADRCPGLPEGADAEVAPITSERTRRRLSVISTVAAQIERELFQDEVSRASGEPRRVRTVRVGFACNQACDFCFVSTHLPSAERGAIEAAIVEAAREGADLALSGGEPTLVDELAEYVALAKREGAASVEVQTNATRLHRVVAGAETGAVSGAGAETVAVTGAESVTGAEAGAVTGAEAGAEAGAGALAQALTDAGVDVFFVSLHGSHAALSDGVTSAPGTFEQTVLGLDAASDTGTHLRLNFVFCALNAHDFERVVALIAERWAPRCADAGGAIELSVSFVAPSTDMVPRTEALIPRYRDVLPSLLRGLERADALGLPVGGFDSMCGIPLCLVPTERTHLFTLSAVPEGYTGGETQRDGPCASCSARTRCFGLRAGYAELYGTDELRPFE